MRPVLDVVIPVYNEQTDLGPCVRTLDRYLRATFPYPFQITIADNASTDRTWELATELVREIPSVEAVHLDQKGRGRALRQVWLDSNADILAYMDVDLSTDLAAVWPLIAPLLSGHSDVAIGTRLSSSSRVVRGVQREFISRAYNVLLHLGLGVRFSDAQCGFKAIRADVAAKVLPLVVDNTWFFDTELLVLAERSGLRIHEVPVDWYDDPNSSVNVAGTALDDLRGMVRVRRGLASGALPVDQIRSTVGRHAPATGVGGQVITFAVVGVLSWCLQLALFALLRGYASAQTANVAALLAATVVNTWANRRWAFGVRGRAGAWRAQISGLGIVGVTLALTGSALWLLHQVTSSPPTVLEAGVVGLATAMSTVGKFVVMRAVVTRQVTTETGADADRDRTAPPTIGAQIGTHGGAEDETASDPFCSEPPSPDTLARARGGVA